MPSTSTCWPGPSSVASHHLDAAPPAAAAVTAAFFDCPRRQASWPSLYLCPRDSVCANCGARLRQALGLVRRGCLSQTAMGRCQNHHLPQTPPQAPPGAQLHSYGHAPSPAMALEAAVLRVARAALWCPGDLETFLLKPWPLPRRLPRLQVDEPALPWACGRRKAPSSSSTGRTGPLLEVPHHWLLGARASACELPRLRRSLQTPQGAAARRWTRQSPGSPRPSRRRLGPQRPAMLHRATSLAQSRSRRWELLRRPMRGTPRAPPPLQPKPQLPRLLPR